MKRLIGLSAAVLILSAAAFTTTMFRPSEAEAMGGLLFGFPELMDRSEGDLVDEVIVRVNKGWLNSDSFSLGIQITGENAGIHDHGYQEVPLSITEVLGEEKALVYVRVDWTTDTMPTAHNETYRVCVQILVNGKPVGDELCNWFGPFDQ